MKSPRDRYFYDPMFRNLVDLMVSHMMQCNYTPSEMREAAMVASIKYYEMRPSGLLVNTDSLHELMLKMEEEK